MRNPSTFPWAPSSEKLARLDSNLDPENGSFCDDRFPIRALLSNCQPPGSRLSGSELAAPRNPQLSPSEGAVAREVFGRQRAAQDVRIARIPEQMLSDRTTRFPAWETKARRSRLNLPLLSE